MNTKSAVLLLLVLMTTSSLTALNPVLADSAEETEPTSVEGTWTQKASMPIARYDMGVGVVDGKIYAIGGETDSGDPTDANQMYDPETDTWTEKAPLPTLRKDFAVAVYQNKIYCIGGASWEIVNIWFEYGWKDVAVNEVYDPETDTWQTEAPMPTARNNAKAAVANGLIYVVGGSSNATINEAYNPETYTWSSKAPVMYIEETNQTTEIYKVTRLGDSTVVSLDGEMYWIGTLWDPTKGNTRNNFMLTYNPTNDSWSKKSTPNVYLYPKYAVSTEGVWAPKQIYVVGSTKAVYNAETGEWKKVVVPSRGDSGLAVVDDKIYCLGGSYFKLKGTYSSIWGLTLTQAVTNATFEYLPLGYGTVAPVVTLDSPLKGAYTASEALVFVTNRPDAAMSYSLDGQRNVTFTGDLSLTEVAVGAHNVTVYAQDSYGNVGASETICFTVELALEVILTLVLIVVAVLAAGGFLIYFKKKQRVVPQREQLVP